MKTNAKEMKGKIVDASERRLGFEVSVYEMWTRKMALSLFWLVSILLVRNEYINDELEGK